MSDVFLARLRSEHRPAMVRWLQEGEVRQNLALSSEPSLDKTLAFIAQAANDDEVVARAVLENDVHVGTIVLDRVDRLIKKARLHVYVGEAISRGRGVGKKAVKLALEIAFGEMALEKGCLTVQAGNVRTRAAYPPSASSRRARTGVSFSIKESS